MVNKRKYLDMTIIYVLLNYISRLSCVPIIMHIILNRNNREKNLVVDTIYNIIKHFKEPHYDFSCFAYYLSQNNGINSIVFNNVFQDFKESCRLILFVL